MTGPAAPPARRARQGGWRDPRVLGGVAIMAASALAGGWLLGAHGGETTVLVTSHDVVAGAGLGEDDVRSRTIEVDEDVAGLYFTSVSQLPPDAHLAYPLHAGELVGRSAVEADQDSGRVEVPLAVAPEDLPTTVRPGSSVDVWVLPDRDSGGTGPARRVLYGVSVLRISGTGSALAPQGTRQVIVTLPPDAAGSRLAGALARIAGGRVLITRRG